jgi:hypothetical protein
MQAAYQVIQLILEANLVFLGVPYLVVNLEYPAFLGFHHLLLAIGKKRTIMG